MKKAENIDHVINMKQYNFNTVNKLMMLKKINLILVYKVSIKYEMRMSFRSINIKV
jgi:hypothetical protein